MLDPTTSQEHANVQALLRAGDYLRAYDAAQAALMKTPDDETLKHASVLSLMRGGALGHAETLYQNYGLDQSDHEDNLALHGRLLKGRLLENPDSDPSALALAAAEAYYAAYQKTGGSYSGVNAASLYYVSGNKDKARGLAQTLLQSLKPPASDKAEAHYYYHATRAEIYWILEQQTDCEKALGEAIKIDPENYAARASTLSQFNMLSPDDLTWLDAYRPPKCAHFSGHIFGINSPKKNRSLDDNQVQTLRETIRRVLAREDIGTAYGALAAGSDILIAECLLEKGGNLHVVLPAPADDFYRLSVEPYGAVWKDRYYDCLKKAKSVRITLDEPGDFDDLSLHMASRTAMGLTRLQAQHIHSDAVQICIVDHEAPGESLVGARADRHLWESSGGVSQQIPWPTPAEHAPNLHLPELSGRAFRAMLFTDLKGYGQAPDLAAPIIVDQIFGPMAKVCKTLSQQPTQIDSWGDGLMLVFEDCVAAAHAAAALMNAFDDVLNTASQKYAGLSHLALRIGAHFGPIWERDDPFTHRPNLYGRHVTLAARIETMALPGSVYVSESFAAVLATSPTDDFVLEYQGQRPITKEDIIMPLFSLRSSAER